jgi:hypothetical protein
MKSTTNFARIAATSLCLAVFASSSFAKTIPLANPYGMTFDAKGNLWVANANGGASQLGEVLVYNSAYIQQAKDTITSNLNTPIAVAFDSLGNLWVANNGPSNGNEGGSIAEYVGGVQNTAATITNGILEPFAMAVDGIGNIWVQNGFLGINVYGSTHAYAPTAKLIQSLNGDPPVSGIAVANNVVAFGFALGTEFAAVEPALASNELRGTEEAGIGVAIGAGNKGDFYVGTSSGSVYIVTPTGDVNNFVQLSCHSLPLASPSTMSTDVSTSPTVLETPFTPIAPQVRSCTRSTNKLFLQPADKHCLSAAFFFARRNRSRYMRDSPKARYWK